MLVLTEPGPRLGADPTGVFNRLSLETDRGARRQELLESESGYRPLESLSGPFEGGGSLSGLRPGDIVAVRVWRPLTPSDLALLDLCGLWPAGISPERDVFAAVVLEEPDLARLAGSGFARSVSRWDASALESSEAPSDWSGYFLVGLLGDVLPPGGEWVSAGLARVPGSPADREILCGLAGVLSVSWEPVSHPENAMFRADDSRRLTGCPPVWEYYSGLGVITGVLDTGVWSEHPDLSDAVLSGPPDLDGHGTAVCGVIASRGTIPLGCEWDGRGVAWSGSLHVIERPSGMTPSQLVGFLNSFETAGCALVNNSWGFPSSGYDDFCLALDSWIDSHGTVVVFSAGNGGEPSSITSPGAAKNCITVGAVTYVPDDAGNCYLAEYSSQGPTSGDGRLKPDILAPGGDFVMESMVNGVVTTNAWYGGQWLDEEADRWPGDSSYTRRAGTSMAAAHVSGAIALCYEKYGNLIHPEDISALLVASAIPLEGNTGSGLSGYATTAYGYGLLDAYHLPGVYFSEEVDRPLWVYDTMTEGSSAREWTFYIPGSVLRISAAMAYCDVAGAGIMNDLDLMLISPSNVEYAFELPAGVSEESPIERVCIVSPEPGAWRAVVTAADWSDPGNPFEEEEYSLAIYSYSRNPEIEVQSPSDTIIYASPGSQLDIPVAVVNSGGYIAAGTWARINAPSGFTGDVAQPRFMGNLVYRNSVAVDTFSVQTPDQPGTYQLTVHVDAANLGLQPDSASFQVILAYPDLVVSIPSPDLPPPFDAGQTVLFSVIVTNQGEGPCGACELTYYLEINPDSSGNPVAVFDVQPLAGGESQSFSSPLLLTYFDLGERYLVAEVDSDSAVVESDESNNRSVYGPFLVEGSFAPPVGLSAESGHEGFVPLEWSPPQVPPGDRGNDGKGLTGYAIYRSLSSMGPDSVPVTTLPWSDTTFVDSMVSNGVTYFYWATCLYQDPTGESVLSNMASATPQGPSGSLAGEVWDVMTGQRLRDVEVAIELLSLADLTDEQGWYSFGSVPVGLVFVSIEHPGYIAVMDTVLILLNQQTLHDFPLQRDLSLGMNVLPNPFTPNGDGINDLAYFIWPAVGEVPLTVTIYGMDGVPLRTVLDEGTGPVWDGRDDAGTGVPGGIYVYMAVAGDQRKSGVICLAR
jgi:hypothetical protein